MKFIFEQSAVFVRKPFFLISYFYNNLFLYKISTFVTAFGFFFGSRGIGGRFTHLPEEVSTSPLPSFGLVILSLISKILSFPKFSYSTLLLSFEG